MISLIKNEIIKILKKKSIYVMLIVTLGFIILTNAIYKHAFSSIMNGGYFSDDYIATIEEEQKSLNPNNPEDVELYINNQTDIDTYKLAKQYGRDSWQYEIISNYGGNYISDLNYSTYREKDEERIAEAKAEYDKFVERINSGDWKSFARQELENAKISLEYGAVDSWTKAQIEILQMRLDYNIEYGNNYKNEALSRYSNYKMQVEDYEQNPENRTYNDKKEYQEAKAEMEKSRYVIENDKDILNDTNLRGILLNTYSEYILFILITVVLIAGAIVSTEFSKGTIKLLLVRPYNRSKILLAKFIVVILTIIFMVLAVEIMQLIVGGIFFGFDSLNIPVVEYDHNAGKLIEVSIWETILITTLGKLPIFILIGTLAFAISTIFTNTTVAITISILGYTVSGIINQFAFYFNISWLKYFITPNWDLTQFFYGKLPNMQGMNMSLSIILCVIYFLIMIIPSFVIFSKRNIKNV